MACAPWLRIGLLALAVSMPLAAAEKAPTRAQALKAITQPAVDIRRAGVLRLGEIGTMTDVDQLLARLDDVDATVRLFANASIWQIWGRSGDRAIDAMVARGVQQMELSALDEAVTTFSEIIRRKPAFAEAWNKRATVYYLLGDYASSMKDCDEVLRRNPNHFGALSGYGQIQLVQGNPEQAIVYFERALKVNPNIGNVAITLQLLRRQLQEKQDKTI
jgi:tetratricopeptide (TPR) repeat protein